MVGGLFLAVVVLLAVAIAERLVPIAYDNLALIAMLQRVAARPGTTLSGMDGAGMPVDTSDVAVSRSSSLAFRSPWNSMRARLALGDYAAAAELVPLLKSQIGQDELRYYYLLTAAQKGERYDWVADLYEATPPPRPRAVISDTIFLSYIRRGAPGDLARAAPLQPASLISHYHLWQQAVAAGEQEAATEHFDRLTYFPFEVFEPTNHDLAEATVDVVLALAEDGVWDQERLLRTAAYLAFRQPEMPAVERLLTVGATRPDADQARWLFLLAELYHRRDQLQMAQAYYLAAIERDPAYWQAARRLAGLWQAQAGQAGVGQHEALTQAAYWYRRTDGLAPGDAVVARHWAEACAALEKLSPGAGQSLDCTGVKPDVDDEIRAAAAELLAAPTEKVRLGPNLIFNGDMEHWGFRMPDTWFFSNQASWDSEANRGMVVLTDDRLAVSDGVAAARFDALALEQTPSKETARYSLVTRPSSAILVDPGQWYAIAISYRTDEMTGTPVTADLVDTKMGSLGIEQEQLPATDGRWSRQIFLRRFDGSRPEQALLWLRGWQAGRVWFDDVSIQTVDIISSSSHRDESRVASR
jgi:tetratricopeptide (TPR) repeat protein